MKFHEKIFKNKDLCEIVMPPEKNNISEFNEKVENN